MINYLFSGVIPEEAKTLLSQDLKGVKVLVGISAGDDAAKNDFYFQQTVETFKELSSIREVFLLDARTGKEEAQAVLEKADVIWLTGGNPYTQLRYIRDNGLESVIMGFDGVVAGLSAGAINQGKVAYYRADEDDPSSTKIWDGLGLVNITVMPHYDVRDEEEKAEIKIISQETSLVALPDSSFIVVKDGEPTIYGESHKF